MSSLSDLKFIRYNNALVSVSAPDFLNFSDDFTVYGTLHSPSFQNVIPLNAHIDLHIEAIFCTVFTPSLSSIAPQKSTIFLFRVIYNYIIPYFVIFFKPFWQQTRGPKQTFVSGLFINI